MKILQAGVAKSGNFWLYKIIQSILRSQAFPQNSFIQNHPIQAQAKTWNLSYAEQASIDVLDIEPTQCFYRISSLFREPIPDIDDYLNQCSHVWTHSRWCKETEVFSKFNKIIYIIRDPRDVAISKSKFAFTPYMKEHYPHSENSPDTFLDRRLEGMMRHWVEHIVSYLMHQQTFNVHVVFYERLRHEFEAELLRLLTYLEINFDASVIEQIRADVAFKTMKDQNPHHVRQGQSGQWAQVLTPTQQERAAAIAGPLLTLLNYSLSADQRLPALPNSPYDQQLELSLEHAMQRAGWEAGAIALKQRLKPLLKRQPFNRMYGQLKRFF